jgi:hypothetical protein
MMAFGIGANVALFTVRGVLLKSLPFHDPDRLVMLYEEALREDDPAGSNVVSGVCTPSGRSRTAATAVSRSRRVSGWGFPVRVGNCRRS